MKEIMLKDFDGRFSVDGLQTFLAISSFLDPRFKTMAFMSEDLRQVTIAKIKQVLSENEGARGTLVAVPTVKKEPDVPPGPPLPSMDLQSQTTLNLPVQEPEPDFRRIKTESDQEGKSLKRKCLSSVTYLLQRWKDQNQQMN